MKVGHYIRNAAPFDPQGLCDAGTQIWVWNHRSHGDDRDIFGYLYGRFIQSKAKLYFREFGGDLVELEDDYAPVTGYIVLAD